ncbi:MAG: blh [Rhodospirillales bacterium]|nr:blh [Rhodospirillales bacterium]
MQAKITSLTDSFSVASQIVADDIREIAGAGFRTLINNRPDNEEPGQLTSDAARGRAEILGVAYHYLPFTASTLTLAEIESFERLMAEADGPVIAHCRSGTRCYLLWAASELRNGTASAEVLIRQAADRGFDIAALRRFQ